MVSASKRKILLLAAPVLLLGWLWYLMGQRPRPLPGLGGSATAIAFSPDGKTIVCASSNNFVQVWKPEIEKWRSFVSETNYMANLPPLYGRLRFSPDGKTLYAGGAQPNLPVSSVAHSWNVATRRRNFGFNAITRPAFDISPDGRWAALGFNQEIHLVDLNGKPKPTHKKEFGNPADWRVLPFRKIAATGNVNSVAFSPDSKTLVVGDENFQWQRAFWNVQTAQPVTSNTAPPALPNIPPSGVPRFGVPTPSAPLFLEWSPDGKRIAASDGAKISIYNVTAQSTIEAPWPTATAAPAAPMFAPLSDVKILAWSPDGQWLFSGGDEVRQWRANDLRLVRSYGVAGPVAVAPDGRTLATASRSNGGPYGVLLWKIG
jgi:WD40 repeat protein